MWPAAVRGIIADVDVKASVATMMERIRAGDVRALARAVSLVEDGGTGSLELLSVCAAFRGEPIRIGVTGPPGAGKSTLVDQMVRWLREHGRTVAVVAIDPSSHLTGGALLGDRIRIQGFGEDSGVFFRSMASRGALGGLAFNVADVCLVLEAAGFGTILIETVGVGQDEVDIAKLADLTLLVLVPGTGDDIQSLKAGIMEVADVFVVNKSDRPGAERVEREIVAMQGLAEQRGWIAPVVKTVALSGEGVAELMAIVERFAARTTKASNLTPNSPGASRLHLDHLGIAVQDIDSTRSFWQILGLEASPEETVQHERVRIAMLPLGETRIELLEAITEDSVIGRFVAKHGQGLHHVALRSDDVDAMFTTLTARGVRLASEAVLVGSGGHRYFFVHPASSGGVLLEIVGKAT
jgi:LAO/AO transport system kinase